ncbi:MAG: TIGR02391 family protein [Actinomycetota bacterium]|nr:TIGR02391 family protein [Actinomycetota bacterium]
MNRRASPPFNTDSSELFSSIEEGLTVGLIATSKPRVCGVGHDLRAVIEHEDLQEYDYVPVKDGERTVGLLHRTKRRDTEPKLVSEAMEPLHGGMLISSDSGILSYIERADEYEHTCRLVLYGDRLDGIVTLSDLQKLVVRPALFLLVTHVELLMAKWIRSTGRPEDKVLARLPKERRKLVEQEWNWLRKNNLAVDQLTATQFCDKRDLLLDLTFVSGKKQKADAKRDLVGIEQLLRNPLAHAGDFALDEEKALEVVSTVRIARQWIDRLEHAIGEPDTLESTP